MNKDLGFACGGSGSLFKTENGGKTWKREKVRCGSSFGTCLFKRHVYAVLLRLDVAHGVQHPALVMCTGWGACHQHADEVSYFAQATDNGVAGNLYAIKFGREGNGFVLGNDAILLKYISGERLA